MSAVSLSGSETAETTTRAQAELSFCSNGANASAELFSLFSPFPSATSANLLAAS